MPIRVLMLDTKHTWLENGPQFDITYGLTRDRHDHYSVPADTRRLARQARVDDYDVIVIGNNLGTGHANAKLIAPELRSRTLIVWHRLPDHGVDLYVSMGYTHFSERCQMKAAVLDLAASSTPPNPR